MYTLYIGNKNYSSWSLRPWILLTELEIPFEEALVPFEDGGSWDKFRAFSPTGLVPCLFDDDITVWESLAITEHIAEAHTAVWPEDRAARAWARSATSEMHAGFSALRNECPMTVGQRIRPNSISTSLAKDLDRVAELWQQGLDRFGGPFLAGDRFTAVDAFFAPVQFRIQTWGLVLPDVCMAYSERVRQLAGMRAWTDAALIEPFREPSHEDEIAELGTITEDLRR